MRALIHLSVVILILGLAAFMPAFLASNEPTGAALGVVFTVLFSLMLRSLSINE